MALYIPHSIFHLSRLFYIRPGPFGTYCVHYVSATFKRRMRLVLEASGNIASASSDTAHYSLELRQRQQISKTYQYEES